MLLAMISRWISDVPSTIAKNLGACPQPSQRARV